MYKLLAIGLLFFVSGCGTSGNITKTEQEFEAQYKISLEKDDYDNWRKLSEMCNTKKDILYELYPDECKKAIEKTVEKRKDKLLRIE